MTQAQIKANWIAVDWGTSNMRAWAMSASGTVLAEASVFRLQPADLGSYVFYDREARHYRAQLEAAEAAAAVRRILKRARRLGLVGSLRPVEQTPEIVLQVPPVGLAGDAIDSRRSVLPREAVGLVQEVQIDVMGQIGERPLGMVLRHPRYPLQFR